VNGGLFAIRLETNPPETSPVQPHNNLQDPLTWDHVLFPGASACHFGLAFYLGLPLACGRLTAYLQKILGESSHSLGGEISNTGLEGRAAIELPSAMVLIAPCSSVVFLRHWLVVMV
jgi:hypothetical protein